MTTASAPISHALRLSTGSRSASLADWSPQLSTSAICSTSAAGIVLSTCSGQSGALDGRITDVIGLTVAEGAGIRNSKHPPTSSATAARVTANAVGTERRGGATGVCLGNNIMFLLAYGVAGASSSVGGPFSLNVPWSAIPPFI